MAIKTILYFLRPSFILMPMGTNVACSIPICQFAGKPLSFLLPPVMILFQEAQEPFHKKKAGDSSAGCGSMGASLYLDCSPQAFRAQHFGLFALSAPDRHPLKVRPERTLRRPFGKRPVSSESKHFAAVFTLCHFQHPSWDFASEGNRAAWYHRKESEARQIVIPIPNEVAARIRFGEARRIA
jgi:hypothetical protein